MSPEGYLGPRRRSLRHQVLSLTPRLEGHNKPITQAIDRALRTNPHKNEQEIYPTLGCDIYALERVDEVDSLAQRLKKKGELRS
jgi:hypothetical protein